MRLALREPVINVFYPYFRHLAGLLRRQHFAVRTAHATMRGRRLPDSPLLVENCDFNSSSLYCGQLAGGANMRPSLPALLFRAPETTRQPARRSGRKSEINRNSVANRK